MHSFYNLFIIIGLCSCIQIASAQNSDILWQKTLTGDTLPIRSIAISEGKYVAVLKGYQIVILDYVTGDSIKSFTAPKDMYGSDIVLGKGGERLYVFFTKPNYSSYRTAWVRVWDISSGKQLTDFELKTTYPNSQFAIYNLISYTIKSSQNGKYLAFQYTYKETHSGSGESTNTTTRVYNTLDTLIGGSVNSKDIMTTSNPLKNEQILSGYSNVNFSQSENYIITNTTIDGIIYHSGSGGLFDSYSKQYGKITSLSPKLKSYEYPYNIPSYRFSSDDDFLLLDNQIYDLPPTRPIYNISKVGFVFLPDDNHMLAFKAGGAVAAISNIQLDTWEKVFQGDSIIENIIQTNASRTAFATAATNRITLWEIPTGLQSATLTANYSQSKDTISIGDTVQFSNKTYPFKRGNIYTWNFGDNSTTNTELHPNHRFTEPGKFTVTLVVFDSLGRSSSISKQVVVKKFKIPSGAVWTNKTTNVGINCITYSPDGTNIASAGYNNARTWDATNAELSKSIAINASAYSLSFTNDGNSIVVGSIFYKKALHEQKNYIDTYNNYMHLWDIQTDSLRQIIEWKNVVLYFDNSYFVVKGSSASSDISSDNKYYLSGFRVIVDESWTDPSHVTNFENYMRANMHYGNSLVYNFENKKTNIYSVFQIKDSSHTRPTYSLKIAPNSRQYVSIVEMKPNYSTPTLLLKDIVTDSILRKIPTTATSMRFSPEKYHLLTNTALWDIYDSVLVQSVSLPQVFEYHPDGIHVFTIRPDSSIGIYNLHLNAYEYIYPKQPNTFTCIAVAPDGKHIATGDNVGFITVWKVPDTLKTSVQGDFTTQIINRSTIKTMDTVEFLNTTLPANDASLYYQWNFGDGTTSIEKSPKHQFIKAGKYTVSLTVFQYGKAMDTVVKEQYISVTEPIGIFNEDTKLNDYSVSIVPSPSYGETHIHLSFADASEYSLCIVDNLGRQVAHWTGDYTAGKEVFVWKSDVQAGVYYCILRAGGVVKSAPIVVMK